ncbi:COP9 signalosome complex subunit 8 [Thoreauomyces humboldtii]|nr:COP9 signalosome complex subunit 8 [Thoreauomyces humboldtii]
MDPIFQSIATRDIHTLVALCETAEHDYALASLDTFPAVSQSSASASLAEGTSGSPSSPTHTNEPAQPNDSQQTPLLSDPNIYTLLQLAHLIQHDYPSARFVAKRAPFASHTPELLAATEVASRLWAEDPQCSVFEAMDAFAWSEPTGVLVQMLRDAERQRQLALMERAYVSVRIAVVAGRLGMQAEEVEALISGRGWKFDDAHAMPPPLPVLGVSTEANSVEAAPGPGLDELANLSRMIVHMESL